MPTCVQIQLYWHRHCAQTRHKFMAHAISGPRTVLSQSWRCQGCLTPVFVGLLSSFCFPTVAARCADTVHKSLLTHTLPQQSQFFLAEGSEATDLGNGQDKQLPTLRELTKTYPLALVVSYFLAEITLNTRVCVAVTRKQTEGSALRNSSTLNKVFLYIRRVDNRWYLIDLKQVVRA